MSHESNLLRALAEHAESFRSGEVISQIGALCMRNGDSGPEVLLITTRASGRWIIPKGWPIDGLDAHKVAEREAWEEAGVRGKADRRPFGYFTYLKGVENGRRVPSVVAVYRLTVDSTARKFPEKGERTIEWHSVSSASAKVEIPELRQLIASLANSSA